MKKNKLHILITISLLAIMLVGRVGIHLFHHHEASFSSAVSATKKQNSTTAVLSAYDSEVDCALCKLDSFQALFIEPALIVAFFLLLLKPVYRFLLTSFSQFSFFTKSRGPPSSVCYVVQ